MPFSLIVLLGLATLAVLLEPKIRKLPLPFTAILVLLGFVGSEVLVFSGIETGLRWYSFRHLILEVLVPILVFESAFHIPSKILLRNLLAIFVLAVPALVASAFISGFILFYGIGYPEAFPLLTALLAGIILSATDPVAVVTMFKSEGASQRLTVLVEGESLFNDATAVVFYSLIIAALLAPDSIGGEAMHFPLSASLYFFQSIGSGVIPGILLGLLASHAYKKIDNGIGRGVISLFAPCCAFYIAEPVLHGSGILAVLLCGLILGNTHRQYRCHNFVSQLWQLQGYMANVIVFILMGVTITIGMFQDQWLAMLIGIGAATISRAAVIYGFTPVISRLPKQEPISNAYKHVLMWGGLRGGVGIALALSLPVAIPGWYTVQAVVYGMVLFTLFIQAPLMPPLIRRTL